MNQKEISAAQTREKLIDAALAVLKDKGAQHLTLDIVAKQAGVSKGGLLHHFPSKDMLIIATARHLYNRFADCVAGHYRTEPDRPGRWLRAYVRASFDPFDVPFETLVNLFAYMRDSADLQVLLFEDQALWNARLVEDGVDPLIATIVRMVCDEFWTERALNVDLPVSPEALRAYLLSMIP